MRTLLAAALLLLPAAALAQEAEGEDVMLVPGTEAPPPLPAEVEVEDEPDGYTPDEAVATEVIRFTGYVDVGFARAEGNGSSFDDDDTRTPLDYGVDAFAPAVNSRGEVASADARGRFVNGFLPRSVDIGATPSLLLNTASADLRFQPRTAPLLVFARVQVMPRVRATGLDTRLELQQAFARLNPLKNQEFAVFLGKFDSVFGIEYLENEANLRPGVTPSLLARYTTGQGLGAKAFYRVQLPTLWSALSLNASATAGGSRIEALVPADVSLTGVPVGAARLGYELNLPSVQAKAGLSGLYGPRNDQRNWQVPTFGWGADLRVNWKGLSLAGEFVRFVDQPGLQAGKVTGQGAWELASGFAVWGAWGRLAWTLPWKSGALSGVTLYGRYGQRHAQFEGYTVVVTQRMTFGARVDLYDAIALKAEYLVNDELSGAPTVNNNVFAASAVYTW